ncbi:hypothetical protein LEN26_004765 [Aphanomyces euteiches]|nr:hypothetical protein AeMF1_002513 [Aphanomyces euteiches]KAH9147257.1 hypothetical protein LEN26_004765 [Aphanomyces euteiches]KAH9192532.1 hypothetical protein AeNC1_005488 [Aphanomyces euteiches]
MLQNKFRKRPTRRATVNVNLGTLSAYRLDSVELVLTKCVVKSDFMSVYMGMLDNQVVAVKQLQSGDIAILELFVKEITLQSSLKGPRVVDYLGACWNDPFDMKGVMEYMDCGDLKSILASHKSSAFPWDHKLKCVQEIVHGLKYIHQLPRVHGALRSKNVLLVTSKGAKLTNFYVLSPPLPLEHTNGPPRKFSLRIASRLPLTFIHSCKLGVILWELESHKVPFADLKNDRTGKRMPEPAVKSLIQQGRATLTFSGAMPPWLYEIALTCLAYDPDQRPSIVKIANAILVGMQPKRAKIGFLTLSKRDLLLLLSFWSVCLTHAAATKLDTVVELFSFHNFLSQDSLTRTWQLSTSLAFCLVVSWTIVFVLATASRHDGTFLRAAKCASGWTI